MRVRHLAAVALVAIVFGAGYWLTASPGGQPAPVEPNTINVTAEAFGSGTWATYVVTVRNLGDQPFFGDLLLAGEPPHVPVGVAPVPSVPGLPMIRSPFSTSIQNLPDDAYRIHLGLAGRHKKTVALQAPAPPLFGAAVVTDTFGLIAAEAAVADLRQAVGVGLLSDSDTLPDNLGLARVGELALKVTVFDPEHLALGGPVGLSGLVAVVIDRVDSEKLDRAQIRALEEWVALGGELVIAGGPDLARTTRGLPASLLPLSVGGSREESLQPVADLFGSSTAARLSTAMGSLAPGSRVRLRAADGMPLAVELSHGAGRVTELLFDPESIADTSPDTAAMAWSMALGWQMRRPTSAPPQGVTLMDGASPDVIPDAMLPAPSDAPFPAPALVIAVLLLYLVVVVPVNYLVLRELRRPALFWLTAPVIALVFTGGTYVIGQGLQGDTRDRQLHLLRVAPDGTYSDFDLHGLTFPSRGQHTVSAAPGAVAAPLTAFHSGTAAPCVACPAAGGSSGDVHEQADPTKRYAIEESGIVYGSVRIVGTASAGRMPLTLDANLQARSDGHLVGTITNRGSRPVGALSVFTYFSGALRGAVVAPELKPGQSISVDATPAPLADPSLEQPSRLAGLAAAARLVYDAGLQAVDGAGSVALAGLVEAPDDLVHVDGAGVGGVATAAFGMPVRLTQGNDSFGDYTDVRLAASRATGGDFISVYDLETPVFEAPASLRYDPSLYSDLDVFDWTAGRWRPIAGTPDPDHPTTLVAALQPSEVVDGLARVRTREPAVQRPSWGRMLTIASSS